MFVLRCLSSGAALTALCKTMTLLTHINLSILLIIPSWSMDYWTGMDNAYKRENSCRNDVEYICELEHLILPEENKVRTLYAPWLTKIMRSHYLIFQNLCDQGSHWQYQEFLKSKPSRRKLVYTISNNQLLFQWQTPTLSGIGGREFCLPLSQWSVCAEKLAGAFCNCCIGVKWFRSK